jgi:sodium transport system permease protein
LIASFARSFKEAQTYLSLLIFLPMAPSIVSSIYSLDSQPWMVPIPALGQQVVLVDVLSGEPVGLLSFISAGLSSLILGLGCVWLTARLFKREKIVFGH